MDILFLSRAVHLQRIVSPLLLRPSILFCYSIPVDDRVDGSLEILRNKTMANPGNKRNGTNTYIQKGSEQEYCQRIFAETAVNVSVSLWLYFVSSFHQLSLIQFYSRQSVLYIVVLICPEISYFMDYLLNRITLAKVGHDNNFIFQVFLPSWRVDTLT